MIKGASTYIKELTEKINKLLAGLDIWRQRCKDKKMDHPLKSSFVCELSEFYLNIKVLLHILTILRVASCRKEKFFLH